jgi:dTDP-4-dehydrorhamnose 3,5-epimerase
MEMMTLRLEGLKLIRPSIFRDARGFFKESYHASNYRALGIELEFVQDNHSFSESGVIRGMHFQSSPGQHKLVWVVQGKIFDVAVDLRRSSPTFGQWEGVYLDDETQEQLYIPAGFAHGFCVVSAHGAHVNYKVSTPYNAETEKTFRYDDSHVQIQWPVKNPILSSRDQHAPTFEEVIP